MVMTNTKKKTNTITKYTNTHTQHIVRCQKDPTCGIFLKRGLFKVSKMIFPCVKHAITNAQIQKYKFRIHKYNICRNARKIQHMVYVLKEDWSRISSESRTVVQGLVFT